MTDAFVKFVICNSDWHAGLLCAHLCMIVSLNKCLISSCLAWVSTIQNKNIESLFIEIDKKQFGKQHNIIVGVIYRPPDTDIKVLMNM